MHNGVLTDDTFDEEMAKYENPRSGSVETWGVGAWTDQQNDMLNQNKPEKRHPQEKNTKTPRSKNEVDITKKKQDEIDKAEEAKKFD